jgi:signal transduction histidine kinase
VNASRLENLGSAAAGIAHDINNQLTLVLNYLAMSDLEGAQAAVGRCSALTGSLLSYCRGEEIPVGPIDPCAFLRAFCRQLRPANGIELVLDLPDGLPEIAGNSVALNRVLTNLVSNACTAMAHRGALRLSAAPGKIEVSDSGPGIPAEFQKRVFEPFFSTTGSGLGLAIVRELMRQQGGWVSLASGRGQGARFTLHFSPISESSLQSI